MTFMRYIFYLLSIFSFGYVLYMVKLTDSFKEFYEIYTGKYESHNERIQYCERITSTSEYVDELYNFLASHWNLPINSYCTHNIVPKNKTIENLLLRITKESEIDKKIKAFPKKYKSYAIKKNLKGVKKNLKIRKVPKRNKNLIKKINNYNNKEIKDLLAYLPGNILDTRTIFFSITMQFLELSKACFDALLLESDNCSNPKYIQMIDNCIFITLSNEKFRCYEETMSEKSVIENLKLFNIYSRKKIPLRIGASLFEDISKRCDNLNKLKSDINFDDTVFIIDYNFEETSFSIKDYLKSFTDYCEKIKSTKQFTDNDKNIDFIKNLTRSNDLNVDKFRSYEFSIFEKLISYYAIDSNIAIEDKEQMKGGLILLNKEEYERTKDSIMRVLKINQWLTEFFKPRTY